MYKGDLLDALNELDIKVRHIGDNGWVACHCPFAPYIGHPNGTDRDASFFVKIDTNGISGGHCFTCKSKGRLSGLARALSMYRVGDGIDYHRIAMDCELKEAAGGVASYDDREVRFVTPPLPILEEPYFRAYPDVHDFDAAVTYLKERGISSRASYALRLRFDAEEQRIMFPVFDFEKKLYGFTGRSILGKEAITTINLQRKAAGRYVEYSRIKDDVEKEFFLLGEHLVTKDKPIILVEGLFALAHFLSVGVDSFANIVATMGSSVSKYQSEILIDYGLPIYMFYDNDAAGEVGIYGTKDKEGKPRKDGGGYKMCPHIPVMIPFYPEGKNDPDELTLQEVSNMFYEAELIQ